MSAPRLTEAEKQKILAAYVAGEKVQVIALMAGVDESYPAHLARRRGIPRRWSRIRNEAAA